ncbi:uncharacterized protein LOC128859713 isoform X1 [Anastrepha ludens]|uniref:uncharacterized protein LOC128859713 isoform X1 n=1 Tax=Anastrepha ludens TaxID=28586 RepID=UPI0023AFDD35|nr:uncharacterized protein LOC128859713 isoform X1 [Anastrepha ludens]
MDFNSEQTGNALRNENKTHSATRLLFSAAEIMNGNEDEEEILDIVNSLECSKCKQCGNCIDGIKDITKTIRSTMIEINELKERNRERRHREFVGLFQKYLTNDLKALETSTNTVAATDSYVNQLNDGVSLDKVGSPQLCEAAKLSDVEKKQQLPQLTRKRRDSTSNDAITETPPKRSGETLNNLNIEPISYTPQTEIIKARQKYELVAMREKMLAMQRRKMEDRERKKRQVSQM